MKVYQYVDFSYVGRYEDVNFAWPAWIRKLATPAIIAGTMMGAAPMAGQALDYHGYKHLTSPEYALTNIQDQNMKQQAANALGPAIGIKADKLMKMNPQEYNDAIYNIYTQDQSKGIRDNHQIAEYTNNLNKMAEQKSDVGGGQDQNQEYKGLSLKQMRKHSKANEAVQKQTLNNYVQNQNMSYVSRRYI